MKNKVVVWGTNAANEKVLIALELKADVNKVMLYTFPEAAATDEFVNKMMNEWRVGKDVEFPEGHTVLERELSVTESLLPEDIKTDRGDLIQRAQTEWQFAILSTKLHAAYQQELAEFKEKVQALTSYDNKVWDSLKAFWDKVQIQSRERNLFREHADNLRDNINALFEDLKKLRSRVNSEFMAASQTIFDEFNKILDDIEARIATGGSKLHSVFEDLKQLQRRYRDARMSNEHRNKLWDRLDGAFKKAKERKFGPSANEGSIVERHERRLGGLSEAIKRMEDSVRRDEDELAFQRKKVNDSEGQLEAQIRMAKIKMIEERLASKREKLAEMHQTRAEVERQANTAKDKETRRAEKEEEKKKIEAAKEQAKSEIAAGIKTKTDTPSAGEKAGEFFEAASTVLGDLLVDALDTAKAVASVAAEKADDIIDDVVQKASEKVDEVLESLKKEEESQESAQKDGIIDDVVHKAGDEELESAKGIIDDVVHKSADEGELESAKGIIDDVVHKSAEEEKASPAMAELVEKAEEVFESAKGIIDDVVHKAAEQVEEVLESFKQEDKKDGIIDDVVHKVDEGDLESASGIIDDVVHKSTTKSKKSKGDA
jgi:vacuolar-type H+-ATPase subunit E/Vma4